MLSAEASSAICVQRFDDSHTSCNSHYVSHFAAFFIVARAKISVVEGCIWLRVQFIKKWSPLTDFSTNFKVCIEVRKPTSASSLVKEKKPKSAGSPVKDHQRPQKRLVSEFAQRQTYNAMHVVF